MDLGLKNKRALVTGASRGLGYATALLLAKEGCKVAINGRDEEKIKASAEAIAQETGTQAYGLAGDAADVSVPERLIEQAVESLGGLDILITNTGGPPAGSFEIFDEAAWQKAVDTVLYEPRAFDPRGVTAFTEVGGAKRVDDHFACGQATDEQPCAVE